MKIAIHLVALALAVSTCQSQTKLTTTPQPQTKKHVGGPCEGCEALHEYGTKTLTATDTLPDFNRNTPQLKLTGTVYKNDGKTPAENVILYIYHTDRKGNYPQTGNETGWAKRHGYLRGWIKTGKDGSYTFYTFRPAAYPDRGEPEHIHITVKEPNKNEYYISDIVFTDDPLLDKQKRDNLNKRAGSGLVTPKLKDGMLTVTRDIVLGLNIPNYE